jgi:polar amino acid transport system substrate-binding protein
MAPFGVDLEPVVTEFGALIPGLLAERFDVIAAGTAITAERCEQITFGNPDAIVQDGLIVLTGNPLDLHSYEDIASNPDALLGIQAGSAYFEYAIDAEVPEDRILTFTDISQAPDALTTGRVDAFATPRLTANEIIGNLTDPQIELAEPFAQPLDEAGNPIQFYLALGFRNEDTDFVEAYNARLAEMKESGELLEVVEPFGFDVIAPADVTAEELCGG